MLIFDTISIFAIRTSRVRIGQFSLIIRELLIEKSTISLRVWNVSKLAVGMIMLRSKHDMHNCIYNTGNSSPLQRL